jgi:hypothetical protein
MVGATFWAILLQIHLVTLAINLVIWLKIVKAILKAGLPDFLY